MLLYITRVCEQEFYRKRSSVGESYGKQKPFASVGSSEVASSEDESRVLKVFYGYKFAIAVCGITVRSRIKPEATLQITLHNAEHVCVWRFSIAA